MFNLDLLREICASFGSIIILIIGAFLVYGLKLLCNKIGIDLDDKEFDGIIKIIKSVIKILDERYVDNIKKNSSDGTLTEKQVSEIHNIAINLTMNLLSSKQVEYLLEKYNVTDLDDIILELIDSNIKETRNETGNNFILPALLNDDEEDDDNEKLSFTSSPDGIREIDVTASDWEESLKVCNADCDKCGLHCEYCRCKECRTL